MARKPNQRAIAGAEIPRIVADLQQWLKGVLYQGAASDGSVRFYRVVCCQLVKGNKRGDESFYTDVPDKADDSWCEVEALNIHSKLVAEAAVLSGVQRWALYAYLSDDNDNHVSRFLVRIDGGSEQEDGDDLASEAPTATGLVSQAQRHSEMFAKINVSGQMTILSAYQQLVNNQGRMIEDLTKSKIEMLDLVQTVVLRQQDHEIEMTKAQAKAKAISELGKTLGLFVPALANKIAGQQLFPVQASAVQMMVKGLVMKLAGDQERLQKILGMMDAGEQTVFLQLLDEVTKEDKAAEGAANGVTAAPDAA